MEVDDNSSDGESSGEENPEAMSDKKAWLAWARALTSNKAAKQIVYYLTQVGTRRLHCDTKVGDAVARTCTTLMEDEKAEKRVSFGLVPDHRAGRRKSLDVTGKWGYLGDMLLSHGETYIGDLVAMGAASIGPGRALAHRVNPVDGDQWVLVVDWVRA